MVGGVCVNTGTIPSKTLREAVLYLTGMQRRDLYGASYRVKDDITISDLLARLQHVIGRETEVIRCPTAAQPHRADRGHGPLPRPAHPLGRYRGILGPPDADRRLHRDRDRHRPGTPDETSSSTGVRVFDTDEILNLEKVPVPGRGRRRRDRRRVRVDLRRARHAGDAGREARAMLDFCDPEIVESLKFHLRDHACPSGWARRSRRWRAQVAARSRPWHRARRSRLRRDALRGPAGQHGRR